MLSLAIIAKDETEQLERIIKDYGEYFGEICIAHDEDISLAENEKVKLFKYEKSQEEIDKGYIFFDRKRNWLASKVSGDYYFRLDTDDDITGVEDIDDVYDRCKALKIDVLYAYYDYGRDVYGNTHAAHYRETIVKVSDDFHWNKRIHENIIPVDDKYSLKIVKDEAIKIIHQNKDGHVSTDRNMRYLIDEFNEDRENCDPRTLAYLGRMFVGMRRFDEAKYFLEKHLELSGWDEDKLLSWMYYAEVFIEEGKYKDALACCFEALQERPDYPEPYLKLHEIYFAKGDWAKAVYWGEKGLAQDPPETFMLNDPAGRTWRPLITMSLAFLNLNSIDEAVACFNKAKEFVPENEWIVESEPIFLRAKEENKFTEAFKVVFDFISKNNTGACKDLVDMVPVSLQTQDYFSSLYLSVTKPKVWEKDSVVLFCGRSTEDWCPLSVSKGIGGSEEAVIQIAKELQAQGKDVTVYNSCGEFTGEYSGVKYIDTCKFNPKDEFDTLIAWRGNFFDFVDLKANNKILWLHDKPREDQFKECKFDKVIVLSEYHKSLLPDHVPEDKIFVSTNGLVPKDFKKLKVDRKRGRMIYASSYDRGLEIILDKWSEIREKVPFAELHIFYGWNTYDQLRGESGIEYKNKMIAKMNQPGIKEHGRVGHKQLLKEYCKSEALLYPTDFAGEINCIALSKAIGCGCRCITNDFAVLPERNTDVVVSNDGLVDAVADVLKEENTRGIDNEFINNLSWANVAKNWIKEIL